MNEIDHQQLEVGKKLQANDVIFVDQTFGFYPQEINRGFYKIYIVDKKIYLDPQNGLGLVEADLEAERSNWHPVNSYEEEAVGKLRKTAGWKLHINFDRTNDDYVAQVSKVLTSLKDKNLIKSYKIGLSSGQAGKEATIYVGSKDDAQKVAEQIEQLLSTILLPPEGDALKDDLKMTSKVLGRFDAAGDDSFHQYGSNGIPYLKWDTPRADLSPQQKKERALAVLRERYGSFFGL